MSGNPINKVAYEMQTIVKTVKDLTGYDFTYYQKDSLHRRIRQYADKKGKEHVSDILGSLIHNQEELSNFVQQVLVGVTEMFRNPSAFATIRNKLVPYLKTYPYTNIWHIGCSTGEEVYSMAIMLLEAGILKKSQLYGTDLNQESLEIADRGIYSNRLLPEYSKNYYAFGGQNSFDTYYKALYQHFKMGANLRRRMVFSRHNLTVDGVFAEAQLVCCRNVLIYFDRKLQNRVLRIIHDSLASRGYLWLGDRESLHLTEVEQEFELVDATARLYRKKLSFAN